MEVYNYIGDNAPNYRIELSGGEDLKETIVEKKYNDTRNTAKPVKLGDKYIVASINKDGYLQLDVFNTNKFLYGDFKPDEVIIYDDINSGSTQIVPIDISVLDYHKYCIQTTVLDSGELHIYLSIDNKGLTGGYLIAGFDYKKLKYKSTIYEERFPEELSNLSQDFGITEPYKTDAGNIIIGIDRQIKNENYQRRRNMGVYISKDKGISWIHINSIGSGVGSGVIYKVSGFFRYNKKGYIIVSFTSAVTWGYEIDKNGENLAKEVLNPTINTIYSKEFTFEVFNDQYITAINNGRYIQICKPKDIDSFFNLAKIQNNIPVSYIEIKKTFKVLSNIIDDKLIIVSYSANETYFTVIEPLKTAINQDVIDISIDRPKNMIGSATIKLNNYMAKYSPDGETNPYKLFPNKEIIIYLGYGKKLKKAFTGYIDSIQMNSFPHIITIQCRDTLKLCKDQLLYYNNKYTHTFKNRTPENLFRILCNAAGVRYGTVEKTGIRLAEVEWNYVSVYDCMEEIAELSGFELSCDENGVLHFREEKPKENQRIVKSFKEGKNITTLDYSIDDSELYHSVIAQGKKEKEITVKNKKGKKVKKKVEEVISYRGYWGPRNFYNLPKNKILVVDANEADNKTDLKKLVDQALYLMTCRARQVSFEAIADTSLKVGDMIRVEETGSTISEVYRITGIGFDLNNSGYTMTIECYHHRNIKPEEDKEE